MHPILLKLGPFNVFGISLGPIFLYTYGLFVAFGFLGAIMTSVKLAKNEGISQETIVDISLWILIFSIVGARVFYIILNLGYYKENPIEIIQVYKGGLVFYGGFIAGILTSVWYTRKHNLSLLKIADILAPGIILGQAFGRIGCFLRGCCYGLETTLPWGITFPSDSLASYFYGNNHKIHPTQIYASFTKFLIFIFLIIYYKKKRFSGEIFLLYMILYSIERFIVEIFRGDMERGFLWSVSTSQAIAIIFFVTGIGTYYLLFKQKNIVNHNIGQMH